MFDVDMFEVARARQEILLATVENKSEDRPGIYALSGNAIFSSRDLACRFRW